nr:TOBE domain-containing protein [Hankyongella ginsenosidimutans]
MSVVNQLPATIQALDPDPSGNVRVTLRVGNAQLLALVTAASAARMRLGPGEPVYALIKALAPVSVAGG